MAYHVIGTRPHHRVLSHCSRRTKWAVKNVNFFRRAHWEVLLALADRKIMHIADQDHHGVAIAIAVLMMKPICHFSFEDREQLCIIAAAAAGALWVVVVVLLMDRVMSPIHFFCKIYCTIELFLSVLLSYLLYRAGANFILHLEAALQYGREI